MLRDWVVIAQESEAGDIHVRHVIQGVYDKSGNEVIYGHEASLSCDCHPQVERGLEVLVVVHRYDA